MTVENKPVRVLILGFSVTAEKNGYVEVALPRLGTLPKPVEIVKVGLGGFHPSNLPPMLDYILDQAGADAVVYEILTSSFREQTNADLNHRGILGALLNGCQERGLPCAFLDLPRTDVDFTEDWATRLHGDVCARLDLPHARVMPQAGIFKDVVHPTEKGCEIMGAALLELLSKLLAETAPVPPRIAVSEKRRGIAFADLVPSGEKRDFERAGFDIRCQEITPDAPLHIRLPGPMRITGLMAIGGPRSGGIQLAVPGTDERRNVRPYDAFCYYERLFPMNLPVLEAQELQVRQLPGVPEIELKKGEKDFGPRVGYLAMLFVQEPVEAEGGFRL